MMHRAGLLTSWSEPTRAPAIDLIKDVESTTGYRPLFVISKAESTARMAATSVTRRSAPAAGWGASLTSPGEPVDPAAAVDHPDTRRGISASLAALTAIGRALSR